MYPLTRTRVKRPEPPRWRRRPWDSPSFPVAFVAVTAALFTLNLNLCTMSSGPTPPVAPRRPAPMQASPPVRQLTDQVVEPVADRWLNSWVRGVHLGKSAERYDIKISWLDGRIPGQSNFVDDATPLVISVFARSRDASRLVTSTRFEDETAVMGHPQLGWDRRDGMKFLAVDVFSQRGWTHVFTFDPMTVRPRMVLFEDNYDGWDVTD